MPKQAGRLPVSPMRTLRQQFANELAAGLELLKRTVMPHRSFNAPEPLSEKRRAVVQGAAANQEHLDVELDRFLNQPGYELDLDLIKDWQASEDDCVALLQAAAKDPALRCLIPLEQDREPVWQRLPHDLQQLADRLAAD